MATNKTAASSANANNANKGTDNSKNNTPEKKQENKEYNSKLDKLFLDMLKDIYWAEKHLVDALKTMQEKATTEELQEAFEDHHFVTQKHVSRLEKVFSLLGKPAEAKKCDAMEGLVKEAEAMIKETDDGSMTRDAALIIAAQKVEHYEIASYGSLVQVALTLGHERIAGILEKTLWDEEDTDCRLTNIAEMNINPMADEEPVDAELEEA